MITETKIKPGYKKTAVGIIPEDWEVKKLGEICKLKSGGTPSRKKTNYWNGDIPWITTSLVNFNTIFKADEYITKEGLENSSAHLFPEGTTIMAIYGQGVTRGKVARLGITAATNQACVAFLNNKEDFQRFLFYALSLNYLRLRNLSNDGSQKNLSATLLKNYRIALPKNKTEQKAIADCLSTWDHGIEKLTALIGAKKEQKKGLMQRLLTGSLRLRSATGEPFDGEWKEVRLGEIGKTINGLTGKNKKDFGEGSPFVTYLNVYNNNKITNKTEFDLVKINKNEKQTCLKFGDIIFTTSSETPHEVGMSSVILFHPKTELYLNSFCFGLRLHNLKTINAQFSSFLFRSKGFRKIMYKLAQGSTRFNLSKSSFNDITLNIPSLEEQTAIAQVLTTADREIELLEQKLEAMKEQKKGLMQVLLTGEKRLV